MFIILVCIYQSKIINFCTIYFNKCFSYTNSKTLFFCFLFLLYLEVLLQNIANNICIFHNFSDLCLLHSSFFLLLLVVLVAVGIQSTLCIYTNSDVNVIIKMDMNIKKIVSCCTFKCTYIR